MTILKPIPTLRGYQSKLKQGVYDEWNAGSMNALAVLSTGGGKTVIVSDIVRELGWVTAVIAHRQELVLQLSTSLAEQRVYHDIIAPNKLVQFIASHHIEETGQSWFVPNAPVAVAGVDTLIRRNGAAFDNWRNRVQLWVQDEAHHVLEANKWGKAAALFPNARGLGVTATPLRADGRGLGRFSDGLFDAMVEGPDMRYLIDSGNLTDYRIFAPPSDLLTDDIAVSATTGDFNATQLRAAAEKSHIVGDVVDHYMRIAYGKLGVTFAVDVKTATGIADKFNDMGVPAAVVSAKTPDRLRTELIKRFKRRELLQLVNVDLFGEGFDLPAIEVVSMARPTQSYSLYAQQFGRVLRLLDGKEYGIVIDHVGNVVRHGLPDAPKQWTLSAREKRSKKEHDPDEVKLTVCGECFQPYERAMTACPYCGTKPKPAERSAPEHVDGDLYEMTPEALAQLRGQINTETPDKLRERMVHANAPQGVITAAVKGRHDLFEMREILQNAINTWGGVKQGQGMSQAEAYKRFYQRFGMDVLTAQSLGRAEMFKLSEKIVEDYSNG